MSTLPGQCWLACLCKCIRMYMCTWSSHAHAGHGSQSLHSSNHAILHSPPATMPNPSVLGPRGEKKSSPGDKTGFQKQGQYMLVLGIVRINHSMYLPKTLPVSGVCFHQRHTHAVSLLDRPPRRRSSWVRKQYVYAGTVANHEQNRVVITIRVCACVPSILGMACEGRGGGLCLRPSSWRCEAEPCSVPTRPTSCCRRPARKDPTPDAGSARPYVLRYARPRPPFRLWLACSTWRRTFRFSGAARHVCPSRR